MKRLISTLFAVLFVVAALCGCAKSTVETKVESKYVDDFAKDYASSSKTDSDGNVTYEFSDEKYDEFVDAYHEEVKDEATDEIKTSGQYAYFNEDITEVSVGINPDEYERLGENKLKEEATVVGQVALKYQMNTKNPSGVLVVKYCNANTGSVYFEIEVTK